MNLSKKPTKVYSKNSEKKLKQQFEIYINLKLTLNGLGKLRKNNWKTKSNLFPRENKLIKPLYKIHKTLLKNSTNFIFRPKPAKKVHNTEKTLHSNSKASIQQEIFPDSLKTAEVTRVFKSGDKDNVSNYRPIAILAVLSNVFKKICVTVYNYLDSKGLLYEKQFGFQRNNSTEHAIL